MDYETFRRIALAFADQDSHMDSERGHFAIQVRGQVISGETTVTKGDVSVREDSDWIPAAEWLENRVALVRQLAERIVDVGELRDEFVTPRGLLEDVFERNTEGTKKDVPDAVSCVKEILGHHPGGVSQLVYLTSDAGEGKTTCINHLASKQARAYLDKKSDWLLLPISLGGRGLLRLDDVVVGTLVNRYRFQLWYYDAFLELVKLGIVVPALDGFEEMFVESATGEAVSALGHLLRGLRGSGAVLVAARKAYFEYLSFETQARLFNALGDAPITTARVALRRWSKDEFLRYCELRGVDDGNDLYEQVLSRVSEPEHPLLTRAVLVRRLLDVAADHDDRKAFVEKLDTPQAFYDTFVRTIVDREIREKWVDRSGEPMAPLLNSDAHYRLLMLLAQEMWTLRTDALGEDVLNLVADLLSNDEGLAPIAAKSVKERLKQHALIVRQQGSRHLFSFDHEEFQHYFLGRGLGEAIARLDQAEVRRLLESASLPASAVQIADFVAKKTMDENVQEAIKLLEGLAQSAPLASALRENCGALCILLSEIGGVSIAGVTFPAEALVGRTLSSVTFVDCYFQPTSLHQCKMSKCRFLNCQFDRLSINDSMVIQDTLLDKGCDVRSVFSPELDAFLYDPKRIREALRSASLVDSSEDQEGVSRPCDTLNNLQRALRPFLRATEINEDVLALKLGASKDSTIELLQETGILTEVQYKGAGKQRRFRIQRSLNTIQGALRACDGTVEDFKRKLSKS